ncbi:MAG: hypothetical protein JO314_08390 [Acidobacteria bacterium]|nr:hypothetical protein [Acidobacteriota bacterium]
MKYLSILLVAGVLGLTAIGCKWSFGSNVDASNNSSNTNRSSTNRNSDDDNYDYPRNSSSSGSNSSSDMTPISMDVSEMVSGSGDQDKVGRMVTVTGGVLENIDSDKLRIRGEYGGAAFYCYGDFSDYMSMADRVRALSQGGRSPKATVKGMYKIASIGTGGELNPCVLSDIQKP